MGMQTAMRNIRCKPCKYGAKFSMRYLMYWGELRNNAATVTLYDSKMQPMYTGTLTTGTLTCDTIGTLLFSNSANHVCGMGVVRMQPCRNPCVEVVCISA